MTASISCVSHVVNRHSVRTRKSCFRDPYARPNLSGLPPLFIAVRVRSELKCSRQYRVVFEYCLPQTYPCFGRGDVMVYIDLHFHYPRVTTTRTSDSLPHETWCWRMFGAALIRHLRSEIFAFQRRSDELQVKRPHTHVQLFLVLDPPGV